METPRQGIDNIRFRRAVSRNLVRSRKIYTKYSLRSHVPRPEVYIDAEEVPARMMEDLKKMQKYMRGCKTEDCGRGWMKRGHLPSADPGGRDRLWGTGNTHSSTGVDNGNGITDPGRGGLMQLQSWLGLI